MNESDASSPTSPQLNYSARCIERVTIERSDEVLTIRLPQLAFRAAVISLAPRIGIMVGMLALSVMAPHVIEGQWLSPAGWLYFTCGLAVYFVLVLVSFAALSKPLIIRATRDTLSFGREHAKRPRQWPRSSIVGIRANWFGVRVRRQGWFESTLIALGSETEPSSLPYFANGSI